MTLIAGLGLICLLAWAFAGGGGKPATPTAGSSRTPHLAPAAAASRSAAASRGSATSPPRGGLVGLVGLGPTAGLRPALAVG